MRAKYLAIILAAAMGLAACGQVPARVAAAGPGVAAPGERDVTVTTGLLTRPLRVAGTTAALHAFTVRIPQIAGQNQQFTLIGIIANGTPVKQGDVLAQFDSTTEVQNALDAKAKFDDFSHQVENTAAQNRANAEQRASDLQQAEADLGKAQLELRKAPILSAIDAQTDQLNVDDATAHVASLQRENASKEKSDQAALKILELQRDQQSVEMARAQGSVEKMTVRAPLAGMVGLVPVFRSTGQGPAQPGDQLYSGTALVRIFDPADMVVNGQINEADGASLAPGLTGVLRLDAYPDAKLAVHFENASPVAVGGMGVPVKTFTARFHVDDHDPRLLPDLSAAVDLEVQSDAPHVLIPRPALHFAGGEPYVTVRDARGQWVERRVELGNFNDQQVAVLSGLTAGDKVRVIE